MNIEYIGEEPCHKEARHGDLGTMQKCEKCGEEYLKKEE